MDISAIVRPDSQESTVKLVSTPFKFECSINMINQIFILHAMELARAKGPPVTQHWTGPADTGSPDLARILYIMPAFIRAF